jgi:uncharacterized protein YdeI (BOF family)
MTCEWSRYGDVISGSFIGYPILTTSSGWTLLVGTGTSPSFGGGLGRARIVLRAASQGVTWFDKAYLGLDSLTAGAPCPASQLQATASRWSIDLGWTNPSSAVFPNFSGCTVVYRTDRYPVSVTDGTAAGEVASPASTFSHTGLATGRYYYGVFSHNAGPANYGRYAFATAYIRVPYLAPTVKDAKAKADGETVALEGKVVTGIFASSFWIQDADRTSGIKVESSVPAVEGSTVKVTGEMATVHGERVLQNCDVEVTGG